MVEIHPSENLEIITLPRFSPKDLDIFFANSRLLVQLKIFASVFTTATVFSWYLVVYK